MTTLLLIRHGENEYTRSGRLAGRLPVALNEKGHKQAQTIAQALQKREVHAIYASPLLRTQQTAEPLAQQKNLPILPLPAVQEVDFGAWQDCFLKDLRKEKLWKSVIQTPSVVQFPNGESFVQAQTRAVQALLEVAESHASPKAVIAIFSHSDMIKLMVSYFLGQPLDLFQRIVINTASISTLSIHRGQIAVVAVNQACHQFA
ncbi:MAG TPA: histidine phosphatase family protein [Anaerolineales bacterium]|nr:histidine phosphatase family protein [Anaerolineales bacterium]